MPRTRRQPPRKFEILREAAVQAPRPRHPLAPWIFVAPGFLVVLRRIRCLEPTGSLDDLVQEKPAVPLGRTPPIFASLQRPPGISGYQTLST